MKRLSFNNLLTKMILVFLLLIIVPLLIVGFISISSSSNLLTQQMKSNIVSSTAQTSKYFDLMFKNIDNFSIQLNSDKEVSDFLNDALLLDESKDSDNRTNIKTKLMTLTGTNGYISTITIVRPDSEVISASTTASGYASSVINKEDLLKSSWYKKTTENANAPVWIDNHNIGDSPEDSSYSASLARATSNATGNDKFNLILIDLKTEDIVDHLADIKIGVNDLTYAITPEGKVISPKGDKETLNTQNSPLISSVLSKSSTEAAGVYEIKISGKDYIVSYLKSDYSKWTFFTLVPKLDVVLKSNQLTYKIVLFGIVFVAIAALVAAMFSININSSMKQLATSMADAERGELTQNIKENRKDEIGMVIKSFNSMISNIKALIIQSKNASDRVNEVSLNLRNISDGSVSAASLISKSIEEIACVSEEQTRDLNNCVVATSYLAETINEVVNSTEKMHDASKSVETLTDNGITVIGELNIKTSESNKITDAVIQNINSLNGYAENIRSIVEMLRGLSDQTELLSLNASIEAARAGEYGRGFSVVADEIRKLSEKSGSSTKEIQRIIEQILNSIAESINLAEKTGEAMINQTKIVNEAGGLFSKVNSTTKHLIEDIKNVSLLVKDMDMNKNQVVESIENMLGSSEESSASAREVSALTQEQLASIEELVQMGAQLNELSGNLNNAMEKFKV